MKVEVSQQEGLLKVVKITVPADVVKTAYQQKIQKVSKHAKLSGFRPGKVPPAVVEQRYGEGIAHEVAGDLMDKYYRDAVTQESMRIAGPPEKVDHDGLKKDADFTFEISVETFPEIKLKSLKGKSVDQISAEVADSDVDDMMTKIRKQHATKEVVERAAKEGDTVELDFDGTIKGEAIEGGKSENFLLEIGSGSMIPGFEDGVVGMRAGDEKTLKLKFPKDYHAEHLAGKKAEFKIKVHNVKEETLPEVDEDFIKKVGEKSGDVEKLKADIRKNMARELKSSIETKNKNAVFDVLISVNDINVPKAVVKDEIKHMQASTRERMRSQFGEHADKMGDLDLPDDLYLDDATRRVKLGLLVSELVKLNDIKADDTQVQDKIKSLAEMYDKPEDVVQWYNSNKQMMAEMNAVVVEELVVEKLLEDAKVSAKTVSYEEAVKPAEKDKKS